MQSQTHWPSVAQFALSALASLGLFSLALLLFLISFFSILAPDAQGDGLPLLMLSAGAGLAAGLLIPSAAYSFLRLIGRETRFPEKARLPAWMWILPLPLVLLAGFALSQISIPGASVLLPVLHLMGIGLPVGWYTALGLRGISLGSWQRFWGILASGLVLAPLIILVLEIMVLLGYGAVGMVALASNPELVVRLQTLAEQWQAATPSLETIQAELGPLLTHPAFGFAVLAFAAGLVPLIEEAFKPIGVWLLAVRSGGQSISPAEGFATGLLSGAGYALFESLALTSSTADWTLLALSRSGTSLLHVFTSGLVGWGLALAWAQGRYLRLGLSYLAAVALHSLWNGITLLLAGSSLYNELLPAENFVIRFGPLASFGLGALAISIFILLLWVNGRLRRQATQSETPSLMA